MVQRVGYKRKDASTSKTEEMTRLYTKGTINNARGLTHHTIKRAKLVDKPEINQFQFSFGFQRYTKVSKVITSTGKQS